MEVKTILTKTATAFTPAGVATTSTTTSTAANRSYKTLSSAGYSLGIQDISQTTSLFD